MTAPVRMVRCRVAVKVGGVVRMIVVRQAVRVS